MKHAFTLIELMIVISIIAIIAAIAIPNIMEKNAGVELGQPAQVKATKRKVHVVARDDRTTPWTYVCRIDNGSDANPRYSEVRFTRDELEAMPADVERR